MKTCVFIAIVVVGLSLGADFRIRKAVKLGKRTFVGAEWLNLVPRWFEWRRLTVEILWDEEGKWPEVRKSRACSRECPVVWPLWIPGIPELPELRVLVLTKRHVGSGNEIALFSLIVTRIINYVHREYQGSFKPRKLKEALITLFFSMIFPVVLYIHYRQDSLV